MNRRTAFNRLARLIYEKVKAERARQRTRPTLLVRTYSEGANGVKDHLTGMRRPYVMVLDDPAEMILARAEAMRAEVVADG